MNRPKHHRKGRDKAVALLLDNRDDLGEIPDAVWRDALQISGYSRRHLRRILDQALNSELTKGVRPPENKFCVDSDCITAVFATCGNKAAAYRRLQRQGYPGLPSLRTFSRAIGEQVDSATKAYAKGGSVAVRDNQLYLSMEAVPPGHTYELDHCELPVWVVPDGTRTPVRPYLTTAFDVGARYPLAWVITFGKPTQEEVLACIAQAATIRLAPDESIEVGGAPLRCIFDRGLDFLADAVKQACVSIDVIPVPLPAYSPHLKPHLERFHRFVKEDFVAQLPGYTDKVRDVRGQNALASAALHEGEFLAELAAWMDWYVTEHPHSTIGCTPLEAWGNGSVMARAVEMHRLHDYFLKTKKNAKVSKNGVRFRTVDYTNAALNHVVGRYVELRYLPHDQSFVDVFVDGNFLCTAVPVQALTDDERAEILKTRTASRNTARQRFTAANRQRKARYQSTEKLVPGKRGRGLAVTEEQSIADYAEAIEAIREENVLAASNLDPTLDGLF